MYTESDIIKALQIHFPEQIGDDAACIPINTAENLIISKDLLVENTHFRLRYHNPETLAHKALHVNLSDLAAMGAMPKFVLLGLSIPPHFKNQLSQFLETFALSCRKASVVLIGGDTTRANQELFISVTVIGTAPTQHTKFRRHAQVGDLLCIAGHIGDAHLGLMALEQDKPALAKYKAAFLTPCALVQAGIWLAKQDDVTSMMDVSDGLLLDIPKLCEASAVGAEVILDSLLENNEFNRACQKLGLDPIESRLAGGEDYSLMCSVKPYAYPSIATAFKRHFNMDLQCIGQFRASQGISFKLNKKPFSINLKPFLHFE